MPKEINPLIKGYKKFRDEYFNGNNLAYEELVKFGQNPKILVIACSDSRVDPAIVTNSKPGELFIIRNVANLIPSFNTSDDYLGTSAALEFGVMNLGIRHIIVFGHSQCGGIANLFSENKNINKDQTYQEQSHISKWTKIAQPAFDETMEHSLKTSAEEKLRICEQLSVINSLKNLITYPLINDKIQQNNLFLHGWYFNLKSGIIEQYDKTSNKFIELTNESWEAN